MMPPTRVFTFLFNRDWNMEKIKRNVGNRNDDPIRDLDKNKYFLFYNLH